MLHGFLDPFSKVAPEIDSLVNPYAGKFRNLIKEDSLPILSGPDLQGKSGTWRKIISDQHGLNVNKLFLEIGCYYGKNLAEMSLDHPRDGFVGIEVTFKRVIKSAEKLVSSKANNAVCLFLNAWNLHKIFAPGELDGVIVFFPDPWEKQKQAKHRLFSFEFCQNISKLITLGGFIWVKTDHQFYFSEINKYLSQAGLAQSKNCYFQKNYLSLFEQRMMEQKTPYFQGRWIRT